MRANTGWPAPPGPAVQAYADDPALAAGARDRPPLGVNDGKAMVPAAISASTAAIPAPEPRHAAGDRGVFPPPMNLAQATGRPSRSLPAMVSRSGSRRSSGSSGWDTITLAPVETSVKSALAGGQIAGEPGAALMDAAQHRGVDRQPALLRDLVPQRAEHVPGVAQRRQLSGQRSRRTTDEKSRRAGSRAGSGRRAKSLRRPARRKTPGPVLGKGRIHRARANSSGNARLCQNSCRPSVSPAGPIGQWHSSNQGRSRRTRRRSAPAEWPRDPESAGRAPPGRPARRSNRSSSARSPGS